MINKCAGIILDGNKILLIRRKGTSEYTSPSGQFEMGETDIDCIERELYIGLGVNTNKFEFFKTFTTDLSTPNNPIAIHSWLVHISREPFPLSDIDECLWVRLSDLPYAKLTKIFQKDVIPYLSSIGIIK
ncbi:MAG: hypothetical protein CENE_00939 [Candidatus Celerinatantimonas neptuna]|nr:MAG: hypothetical protein CENE_00939 [Candidatus Celerinatantimonas neptuna]